MSSSSSVRETMDASDGENELVPSMETDMETAIKRAICCIEELHEEKRRILMDISKSETAKKDNESNKRRHSETGVSHVLPSVEVVQVNVFEVSKSMFAVSITCKKKNGSMVSMCKALESLNLIHLIKFNITCLSKTILFTLFVQSEQPSGELKETIETAISQI